MDSWEQTKYIFPPLIFLVFSWFFLSLPYSSFFFCLFLWLQHPSVAWICSFPPSPKSPLLSFHLQSKSLLLPSFSSQFFLTDLIIFSGFFPLFFFSFLPHPCSLLIVYSVISPFCPADLHILGSPSLYKLSTFGNELLIARVAVEKWKMEEAASFLELGVNTGSVVSERNCQ